MNPQQAKVYKNPNNDPKGRWRPVPMTAQAGHATKDQFYPIVAPGGKVHYPPEGRCWGISETTYMDLLEKGEYILVKMVMLNPISSDIYLRLMGWCRGLGCHMKKSVIQMRLKKKFIVF